MSIARFFANGPLLLVLGCAARPSGGMATEVFWADMYNGGNCGDAFSVDGQGVVSGSTGCEEGAVNNPPQRLTPARRKKLVIALDRLRASSLWREANGRRCSAGISLRVIERSGEQREGVSVAIAQTPMINRRFPKRYGT